MCAKVNQRVDAPRTQPGVEGNIGVPRRQIGIVILRFAVGAEPAVGLQCHHSIARLHDPEAESTVVAGGIRFAGPQAALMRATASAGQALRCVR